MPDPIRGARNRKETRVQIRLAGTIDKRMERLSDMIGMNKGTTASLCAAVGLRIMEQFMIAQESIGASVGEAMMQHGAEGLGNDLDALGIPHT